MMIRHWKRNVYCMKCVLLTLMAAMTSLLVVPTENEQPFNLRRARLLEDTTREYPILLHLSLEYVNDTVARQFVSSIGAASQTDAVRHFCDSVNQQAGGNQVEAAAADFDITVETEIRGTLEQPDFQCDIVYAGRIEDSAPDASSSLYALGVTVEQIVHVTADRSLSLGSVTSIVQSGFNRGNGGRVRFRSLLRDHPMFATVVNVELLDGALTRPPTLSPTELPSVAPSLAPSSSPTLGPNPTLLSKAPSSYPSEPPSKPPTTAKPSQPWTPTPTEIPSNDQKRTDLPVAQATDPGSDDGKIDPWYFVAVIVGSSLILIAFGGLAYACWRSNRKNENNGNQRSKTPRRSKKSKSSKAIEDDLTEAQVPVMMVQLDEDNRSLANTTLGDQTAGRVPGEHASPLSKSAKASKDSENSHAVDENSLYTAQKISVTPAIPTDSSRQGEVSQIASSTSNSNSMLPPSVMPYEESSLMFPVENVDSSSASTCSEALESSLLSESFTSSSVIDSDAPKGPVDVDALEIISPNKAESTSRLLLLSGRHSLAEKEERKEPDTKKQSVELEASDEKLRKGSAAASDSNSRFSPFEPVGAGALNSVKFDFDKHSKVNSSFHSLEEGVAPSVASSTSSLTKKAENLFFFGFQPPPEDHKSMDSPRHVEEEEKREIECETRDDDKDDDDGLLETLAASRREAGRAPLPMDLLADHQLLERSPSPASWSSWKMPQVKPPQHREARTPANWKDESKSAPAHDLKSSSASKVTYRHPSRDSARLATSTPSLRHFLPRPAGETKEASPVLARQKAVIAGEAKENSPRNDGQDSLTAALSALSSKTEDGTGILGVQPRKDAEALEARSGSSSSTGQNNPWLFEAVEQTLGPRSVTADMESLSGRSNRSGKSHRSNRSRRSHRSHKSNRSYNVPPSGKYKGRGEGRIRSAAASVASYGGSSLERRSTDSATKRLTPDINKLEMQLAALRTETDHITASSITLSSVKTRSTRSSKLTHTGAKITARRRVVVEAPPGKLGVVLANRGHGAVVSEVRPGSCLKGMLSPGDKLVAIDGQDVQKRGHFDAS